MKIVINKLFGKFNTKIKIDKKLNILVGENGVGKSNILRICNLVLNNNYAELTKYYFDSIEIYDDNLKNVVIVKHDSLFPSKDIICKSIKARKLNNFAEEKMLIFLIEQLWKNNLLNEFIVYCYFNSHLGIRLDRVLEKYAYNKQKQENIMKDILSDLCKKNSKKVKSFVSISEIIKIDKNCYYLNFVENYKIENKLHKNGNILKGILDAENLIETGKYKFVYDKEDDDEIFNIYEKDKYEDEINKNLGRVERYNFKSYKTESINIKDVVNKLIKEKYIDINKLISYVYYDKEFIERIYSKLNNLDEKYKDYFMAKKYNLAQKTNKYIPSSKEIQKIEKFYEDDQNKDIIKNYILPLMPKNSPYEFFITRAFSDKIINEDNYLFFRLYEIYNYIIEDIRSYKNQKIIKLEKLLNKYIRSKEIIIKPTGIHIFDKEICAKEQILKTNYEKNIELDYLSAGEKKIIILLTLGMFVEQSIFIIDEIENSLSIIWQEEIIHDLVNISKQNNLIIATQSAYALKNKSIQKNILFLPFEEV